MRKNERLYYFDWLRVLAFWLLIFFHSWQPFNNFHWLIESNNTSIIADILTVFTHGWRLHLIFLVSGLGTWFAMKTSKKQFFKDRFKRLIIPFAFASILITPSQRFFQAMQDKEAFQNYLYFLESYPSRILDHDFSFSFLLWFKEIGIHLWYLPYLLVMTFVLYPIFTKIKNKEIKFDWIKNVMNKPYGIFVLALPIFICRLILKPIFPAYTDWADFFTYLWSFLYGFVLINDIDYWMVIIKRNKNKLLIVGVLCSLSLIIGSSNENLVSAYLHPKFDWYHVLITTLSALIAFSWIMYFVDLFSEKMNFKSSILPEANNSILPIYVLHQSIIVAVGYYVVQLNLGSLIEFLIILITTILTCLLLYKFLKRNAVLKTLFGIK
ncbi:acyltransferase family protein [Polaribacter sp. P097]|uniref:acyltransferase family protein n=1 Tax=Polaribacter sp. P097 TaxID=3117398 RepID=UPI002FE40AEC